LSVFGEEVVTLREGPAARNKGIRFGSTKERKERVEVER
jgi:hypothetical protein